MQRCVNALRQWTGKAKATVVYDSTFDEFMVEGLFDKVKGKPNIAIIATTMGGDVFGGFYSVAATKQDEYFFDPTIFVFSFESHGRCQTPKRFPVKEGYKTSAYVKFWKDNHAGFVSFGAGSTGWFWLGNERSNSFCYYMSLAFQGLEDTTLTGRDSINRRNINPFHNYARLVAVLLE